MEGKQLGFGGGGGGGAGDRRSHAGGNGCLLCKEVRRKLLRQHYLAIALVRGSFKSGKHICQNHGEDNTDPREKPFGQEPIPPD